MSGVVVSYQRRELFLRANRGHGPPATIVLPAGASLTPDPIHFPDPRPGPAGSLGWLPALMVVSAIGSLLVALGDMEARKGAQIAAIPFWAGMLLIFVPVALRQAHASPSRAERIGLLVLLGLGLYLSKIWFSPRAFVLHDEFLHWRSALDIVRTHHLFHVNPLLLVSPSYPGLETITAAVSNVSGLSVYGAGILVVGVARLIQVAGLYLLYEEIGGSPRIAGVGTVLAITYPNFVFWSSQFSYESLALPLAILVILIGVMVATRLGRRAGGLWVLAVLILGTVLITHHLTSYLLTAFLMAGTLVGFFGRPVLDWVAGTRRSRDDITEAADRRGRRPVLVLSLLAFVGSMTWLVTYGQDVLGYLSPHIQTTVTGVLLVFSHHGAHRAAFGAPDPALAAPLWERVLAYASVLVTLLWLVMGLARVFLRRWNERRRIWQPGAGTVAWTLVLAALSYPAISGMRLVGGAAEISNRMLDFLSVALGFVLAVGIVLLWLRRSDAAWRYLLFGIGITIVFMGGLVVGTPPWARMPGSFLVGGDTRSIQPESVDAARWTRHVLGPDKRLIANQTNVLLMGSFGEEYPVSGLSWIYFSPRLGPLEMATLHRREVQYVVVDRRLTRGLPTNGFYFEEGEPQAQAHTKPMTNKQLSKFDHKKSMSRLFDSGNIQIYSTGIR